MITENTVMMYSVCRQITHPLMHDTGILTVMCLLFTGPYLFFHWNFSTLLEWQSFPQMFLHSHQGILTLNLYSVMNFFIARNVHPRLLFWLQAKLKSSPLNDTITSVNIVAWGEQ